MAKAPLCNSGQLGSIPRWTSLSPRSTSGRSLGSQPSQTGSTPVRGTAAPFALQVRPSTFQVEEAGSIPVRGTGVLVFGCLVCDASGEATALSRQRGGFNSRTGRSVVVRRPGSGGPCIRLKSGTSWFDPRGRHMREELEWSSIGPTHRGTGFDSLLAHTGP